MRPIMVDSLVKCENYQKSRQNVLGWHDIQPALPGSVVWRQRSASIRGSGDKHNCGPRVIGKGPSGYITKKGFVENT